MMFSFWFQIRKTAFFNSISDRSAIFINIMKFDRFRVHPRLHLKIIYNSFTELCVPIRVWKRSGVYGKHPGQYYVSYTMRTTKQVYDYSPTHVLLTKDTECSKPVSTKIPIYNHGRSRQKKMKFGLCLHQALYNEPNKMQDIIDWIVIHQLMGVEIIYIYLEAEYMAKAFLKTVEPFVQSGLVELIDWSIGIETSQYGQFGVIQDCLYRSKSTVEYLAMYDLDEMIVPCNPHTTWSEMIAELKQYDTNVDNYATLSFEDHVWVDNGHSIPFQTNYMCSNMSLPVYLKRTQRIVATHAHSPPKLIIRPKFVDSCWIHYVLQVKSNIYHEYKVPFKIGSVHHYRVKEYAFTEIVYDDTMQKYANTSIDRIKKYIC